VNVTEEAKTLPPELQTWVRLARIGVGILAAAALAIAPAITAYRSAVGDAQVRTQQVKDKSEAGYQVTRPRLEALEREVAEQGRILRQLAGQQHPAARRGSKPRLPPAVPPPPAPPPKALPHDLDQAQRQVYAPAPPPPAPRGDAAP
jgi:hypothetical protein